MKKLILLALLATVSCSENKSEKQPKTINDVQKEQAFQLSMEEAYKISQLPITCITTEFPNKTSQSLRNAEDLGSPSQLHPAFYGCFDWHSSVHGHWSIAAVLNNFPDIKNKDTLISILKNSISEDKIAGEITYFNRSNEYSFERTYGWAWLLKLSEALKTSNIEELNQLHETLQPLTEIVVQRYLDYLPKLQYPTRVGTHTNTAFGLRLAYDYALNEKNNELKTLIEKTADRFFKNDADCPISWEPGGSDFLSPCLEEADLMRKILSKDKFKIWFENFLPEMKNKDYQLATGIVGDRSDGHLVHLDGLNYSRAWCLYGIANTLGEDYNHLIPVANNHIKNAIDNLNGDTYEGSHWLGTFALYALIEGSKI
ncbi:Protein of unknown function [Pustulibacterium marinum]|uniref:DUF2891 domain-containing protein n=1 Tax=Pustulibacterium marinum TaxID=1224947 RepID=A0A1I7HA24_9FLAO|nr:DUF2891 domain-containing protein [Pustulibacterium marinum]SFU57520.1 Protein of unknown function [Pustulibacterium marinum]